MGIGDWGTTFIIRVTYLQIYNESIDDLLKSEKKHLTIRENHKKGIYVEGLSEWAVCSPNDIYALLEKGAQNRTKAHTNMNDVSSRSHAVFTIILELFAPISILLGLYIGYLLFNLLFKFLSTFS